MPRVRKGAARHRKHKKAIKAARGFYGAASRRYRQAVEKTYRAGVMATRDRQRKKRDFRSLWIIRVSAACKQRGIRYSQFMHGLSTTGIRLNRKMLSEIAIADPEAFDSIVEAAMKAPAEPSKDESEVKGAKVPKTAKKAKSKTSSTAKKAKASDSEES